MATSPRSGLGTGSNVSVTIGRVGRQSSIGNGVPRERPNSSASLPGRLRPIVGVLGQAAHHDPLDLGRDDDTRVPLGERRAAG